MTLMELLAVDINAVAARDCNDNLRITTGSETLNESLHDLSRIAWIRGYRYAKNDMMPMLIAACDIIRAWIEYDLATISGMEHEARDAQTRARALTRAYAERQTSTQH